MKSLLVYLISSTLCILGANIIKSDDNRIIDIIHYNIPKINVKYLSDTLVLLQTVFTISLLDSYFLSQFFLIMGIVQFFRFCCFTTTVLPHLKTYSEKYRLGGINGTGTEYIFSGHASYCALTAIYLYTKGYVDLFPLFFYNIFSQFMITASRNHYTVDIVLAWIITPLVWSNVNFCLSSIECSETLNLFL